MKEKLTRVWLGPLPPEHIWISPKDRPTELWKIIRVYYRKWFIHPLKRHISRLYLKILHIFFNVQIIAITGSAGKTTTKEIILNILSESASAVATFANIDPVYNIPTTILRCLPKTKFLILEMGIEYKGEMDFYTWLAHPNIAVITNVDLTHTQFLNDIKTVGYEKGKIANLSRHLVISVDPNIQVNTKGEVHVVPTPLAKLTSNFKTQIKINNELVELSILGTHLATNVALAVEVAKILKISNKTINIGLQKTAVIPHRLQIVKTKKYGVIIDDSYNANPLAVRASINTLVTLAKLTKKQPVLVLSQMNELGTFEKSAHEKIKEYIIKNKINLVYTIGPATTKIGRHFGDKRQLILYLKNTLTPKNLTLIKGSRGWKLEEVVSALVL